MSRTSKREPIPRYQLILNHDGGQLGWERYPMSPDRLAYWAVEAVKDTQVDAIFWCASDDGNSVAYKSDKFPLSGEADNFGAPQASGWRVYNNVCHLVESGVEPPRIILEACRRCGKATYFSLRLNDTHDAHGGCELPQIKRDHPEWMLGKAETIHTALNFAIKGVRQFKLDLIDEFFQRFDYDGIEIDFLRGAPYFKHYLEHRHANILTDWLRNVRELLDRHAERRGRRVELAVRVNETIESSFYDGFDVETWIHEGLTDAVILGSGAINIDIAGHKKLAEGTHVRIYPCVYGWANGYGTNVLRPPKPDAVLRGDAARFWADEPDGIYLFNTFPMPDFRFEVMQQLGDPATLAGTDKVFCAEVGSMAVDWHYPHNWLRSPLPVELHETDTTPVSIPVVVSDDVAREADKLKDLKIVLEFENMVSEVDELDLSLNGQPVDVSEVFLPGKILGHGPGIVNAVGAENWVLRPGPARFRIGMNRVGVRVVKRCDGMTAPLTLNKVEIFISYKS